MNLRGLLEQYILYSDRLSLQLEQEILHKTVNKTVNYQLEQ